MTTAKGWAIEKPGRRGFVRTDDGTVALYPTRGAAKADAFTEQKAVRVSINVVPSEGK